MSKTAVADGHGKTGDLGLQGGKPGKHKKLNGEEVDERPDSLVTEAARKCADILDKMDRAKQDAPEAFSALEKAFKNSKRQRKVTITTEWNVWTFRAEQNWKIIKKREIPVK